MKLKIRQFVLANLVIGLAGIIGILSGILIGGSFVQPLLESIGIGLLAAALVNLLDRVLILEAPVQRIEVVAEQRNAIPDQILDRKFKAKKVDIIGVSLNHFLYELTRDSGKVIISRLLQHNLQLRIFLVNPASKYLEQRAFEDNEERNELVEHQKEAVKDCIKFYEHLLGSYNALKKAGKLDTHLTGSLQIILLDCCPYVTVYRVDDDIYWGVYTSNKSGVDLPLFKTSLVQDPILFNHLHEHIHGLIGIENKYPRLVNMPNYEGPTLAKNVAEDALK